MPDRITRPNLDVYGNFFGVARTGPRSIDLDLPIITVLDVSRQAEVGSGFGPLDGWWAVNVAQVHAGAGSIETNSPLLPLLTASGFNPQEQTAWLFDSQIRPSVAAAFTSAFILTSNEVVSPGGAGWGRIFRRFAGELVTTTSATVISIPTYESKAVCIPFIQGPTYALIQNATVAGACTLTYLHLFWIGARGALPPFTA